MTLANGFRVIVIPNPRPTRSVSLRLVVAAGTLVEAPAERGLAHLIEHLAFRAAPSFVDAPADRWFAQQGVVPGHDMNALTTPGQTLYRLDVSATRAPTLEAAFTWLGDVAGRLRFTQEQLETELPIVLAELADRAGANLRALQAEVAFLGRDLRYHGRVAMGRSEALRQASLQQLAEFYERWYTPNRMTLVAVGDIDADRIRALAVRYFGSLVQRPSPGLAAGRLPARPEPIAVHLDPGLPVVSARIRVLIPGDAHHDGLPRRLHRLHLRMLHDGLTRRLRSLNASNSTVGLDAVAAVGSFIPEFDTAALAVTGHPSDWAEVVATAERELRRFLAHGLTDTELHEQRTRMLGYFQRRAAASMGLDSSTIADQAVAQITTGEVVTDAHTDLLHAEEAARDFGSAKARALIQDLWKPDAWRMFVAGPPGHGLSHSAVLTALRQSQSQRVPAAVSYTPAPFAYHEFGAPAQPARREVLGSFGLLRLAYANGVFVNLLPTGHQRQSVLIRLRVGHGGASVPPGKPHLLALANRSLIAGGLEAHTLAEVATIFAGKAVGGRFNVGLDAFELDAGTTPQDLTDQLRILVAFLLAPGLRDEAVQQAVDELNGQHRVAQSTLSGVVGGAVSTYLRGDDPRFGLAAASYDLATDAAALRAWLRPQLRDGPLEVNVVGDILPEEALSALNRTVGAMPPRAGIAPPPPARYRLASVAPGLAEFPVLAKSDEAMAMIVFPVPDRSDTRRALRLEVLATMLDEHLRKRLREEKGLVYNHYSAYQTVNGAPDHGLLTAQATTTPARLEEVERALVEAVRELTEQSIMREAFASIGEAEATRFARRLEHDQFWLHTIAGSVADPAKLAWPQAVRAFGEMHWNELHALATAVIRAERMTRIRIRP